MVNSTMYSCNFKYVVMVIGSSVLCIFLAVYISNKLTYMVLVYFSHNFYRLEFLVLLKKISATNEMDEVFIDIHPCLKTLYCKN